MILEHYDPELPELVTDVLCMNASRAGIDTGCHDLLDYTEIDRLEAMMKERHPDWPYTRRELNGGQQICFLSKNGKMRVSAVIHGFSYGHERGLLEFWDKKSDPVIVDAEYALMLFEKALKGDGNTLEET